MKTIPLNFSFKEHRNYIHGPDIYNQMLEEIKSIYNPDIFKDLKLEFHKFASNKCNMILGDIGKILERPTDALADLLVNTDDGELYAFLVQTDSPITNRISFDEGRIEALCEITGDKIVIKGNSSFSAMEVAVSMTKQLHYKLFPINQGKWDFTRLELTRPLESADSDRLTIVFKHNFNNRLTKSELFYNQKPIGYIYFSLVKR